MPILPTVMSTSVDAYQSATLVVTEQQYTSQQPVIPIVDEQSQVITNASIEQPVNETATQKPLEVNPALVVDPGVYLAKPAPLLTDITLGATPSPVQVPSVQQTLQMT